MPAQARVKVLNETSTREQGGWNLSFQYCRYEYGDGTEQQGYRFIWKRPNGNLQGARGQARIPSVALAMQLMAVAIEQGWGHHIDDYTGHGDNGEIDE